MKKIIGLLIAVSLSVGGFTQNILSKIPADAAVVIRYSGENLTKSVPVSKIDSYDFIKNKLYTLIGVDSLSSIQQTGINLEKDICQYVLMQDSSVSFITLMQLKNEQQFLQLMQKNNKTEIIVSKDKPHKFLTIADDKYLGWTDQLAVLVYTTYTKPSDYYYYPSYTDTTAAAIADSAYAADPGYPSVDSAIVEPPLYEPEPAPKKSKKETAKAKKGVKSKKGKKGAKKAKPVEVEPVEDQDWTEAPLPAEDTIIYDKPLSEYSYADSIENAKREQWYKEKDIYINAKQKAISDSLINAVFTAKPVPIENDIRYTKTIDPSAHVSAWLNYDNLMTQLWSSAYLKLYGLFGSSFYNKEKTNQGFTTGINLFFDKDKIRVEQKLFSPDEEMAKLGRDMYKSKQKTSLTNYINPGNIAYFSGSFNTEAVGRYYYKMMKQYLSDGYFFRDNSELVNIYIDLMEIIIDEKAIAELMPGNMVMVLHDMTSKTVSYTTYEYDKDFNQTEIKKTKKELSPNFTIAFETKRPDFLQKLVDLPVKYAEKEKFKYANKGGYYEFSFDPEKDPISSLFFIVKDDKVVITTSKEMIDLTLSNESRKLSPDIKKSVFKNNYSFKINTEKLLQQVDPELSTETMRKIKTYLEQNIGNVQMESKIKDGMIQSTGSMSIKGTHHNSFEFLFNIIDNINTILSSDKNATEETHY
ncbi:MAG: hypothetical protein IT249_03955 [Chitinophagaceae bacterium]|nr:hypothetical protein [Chitinophagaceae bacterium]